MYKYLCLWYLTLIVCGPILGQLVGSPAQQRVLAAADFDPSIDSSEEQDYVDIAGDGLYT